MTFVSDGLADSMGFSKSWAPFLTLFIIPGYLVIAYCTLALLKIFLFVRKVDNMVAHNESVNKRDSSRRTSGTSSSLSVAGAVTSYHKRQRAVFWQSLFYLSALYISWFFYLGISVRLEEQLSGDNIVTTALFLVYLNGFLNCMIYFRQRFSRFVVHAVQEFIVSRCCKSPGTVDEDISTTPLEHPILLSIEPEEALITVDNQGATDVEQILGGSSNSVAVPAFLECIPEGNEDDSTKCSRQ